MDSLRDLVIKTLIEENGLSDHDIASRLAQFVPSELPVAHVCRQLEVEGMLKRIKRIGKPAGNYITRDQTPTKPADMADDLPAEDEDFFIDTDSLHLNDLHQIGFQRAGEWFILRDNLNYSLNDTGDRSQVLYALVVDGTVVFLDRATRSLAHRMNYIMNPGKNLALTKINGFLKGIIKRGKMVEVYALIDPGTLQFAGYRISLAAGIEQSLLDHFRPAWNINQQWVA